MSSLESYKGWYLQSISVPEDRKLIKIVASNGVLSDNLQFFNENRSAVTFDVVRLEIALVADDDGIWNFGEIEDLGWDGRLFYVEGDFGLILIGSDSSSPPRLGI